ncbi:hypothetical protein [Arthrobacter mobilis]|uniref:Repeat domain-containing protein n=1 Tax=Arthrobacter mobilis TaxID=2724944 RepID=A0A7X6HCH2_9MICC|nr:hypothetical protein [Arthrobacter mobilis]NKX53970.1 hypothetical protein [Arthrobacter mobilis]
MKTPLRTLLGAIISAALLASLLAAGTPAQAAAPRSATYQTYTAPNGASSKYHVYADGIDTSKPVGVVFVFHGDYSYPSQSYVHHPTGPTMTKMAAEAAKKNMIMVPVITPDQKGGITWWEDKDRNGDYFRSLAAMLIKRYGLDASRIWFHGYSGGAEFITFEVLADRQGWIKGGGATIVGGGGYRGMQTTPPAAVKKMRLHWISGSLDGAGGTTLAGWSALDTARRARKIYQGLGFTRTQMTVLPGVTHYAYDMPVLLASDLNSRPIPIVLPKARAGDIAAVAPDGILYIYPSAKGGDLYERTYVSGGWGSSLTVEIADWNSDGYQDLVANWTDGRLTVDYGRKNGGFKRTTLGTSGWQNNEIIVTRWKTTDEHPGIVARNRNGRLYYYTNPAGGMYEPRKLASSTSWRGKELIALDFDQDNKMDLIAKTPEGDLKLYRSNGKGRITSETRRFADKAGWNVMEHLSAIESHVTTGQAGILARDRKGNLYYYPVSGKKLQKRLTIGVGGWDMMKIGS